MSTKQSHGLVPNNARSKAAKPRTGVNVQTGHDGHRVVMIFNQPITNLQLTPQECVAQMAALKKAYDELMVVIDGRA